MAYAPCLDEIRKLREATLASIAYCKDALVEAQGNFDAAIKIIQRRGQAIAADKAERGLGAGIIDSYIHNGKQIGVLLDLRCETDFVARNEEFLKLAHELCLQIVASNPQWLSREDIPEKIMREKQKQWEQELETAGKKGEVIEKAMQGKLQTFYKETCLLDQPYIRDESQTVRDIVVIAIGKIGENIKIKSFCRFAI